MELDEDSLRARIAYAETVRMDIDRFRRMFPSTLARQTSMPDLSWESLERQLSYLAASPEQRAAVPARVSALRRMSPYKPAEMVLQEILIEAFLLLDASPASADREEVAMS